MHFKQFALTAFACLAGLLPAFAEENHPPLPQDPWQRVPEILARIQAPEFTNRDFLITDYGANPISEGDCTKAIAAAIDACHQAGGGRVVVPAGNYHSGAIHLKSNVNFHLAEGAKIVFSDRPEDYLPVVLVRVGGIELYNYSPLIYARDCQNIAVTGPGELHGNGEAWRNWRHHETKQGFQMAARGVPVSQRVFGTPEASIRPSFLSFVECQNILLEDFTIGSGPNWTIHPIYCQNVTVRGVQVLADGPNNDGIDPDSCQDMLIEDCTFDTGDDCMVLKSGYNEDGWRIGRPTENVVIRNCRSKRGHGGLVIGSEMSGDVRNVYMEDCQFDGTDRVVRIKSRVDRGGIVENVFVRNIVATDMQREFIILNMDYGADRSELKQARFPVFRNMLFEGFEGSIAPYSVRMHGRPESPISGIHLRHMNLASTHGVLARNVEQLHFDDVQVQAENGPVFQFENAQEVTIAHSVATSSSAKPFVRVDGAESKRIVLQDCDLSGISSPIEQSDQVPADAVLVQ